MKYFIANRIFLKSFRWSQSGWIQMLAILGITFSVMVTVMVISVLQGFEKSYEKSLLGFNSHLVIFSDPDLHMNSVDLKKEISQIMDELDQDKKYAISSFVFKPGIFIKSGKLKTITLKGIDFEEVRKVYEMDMTLFSKNNEKSHLPEIILGSSFYENEIKPKNNISLWLPQSQFKNLNQNFKQFQVKGIFHSGLHEFDYGFALIDRKDLAKLLGSDDLPLGVEMRISDYTQAEDLAKKLREKLPMHYEIIPWNQLNQSLFEAMKLEKVTFLVIMILIVMISSFNIMGVCLLVFLKEMKTFFLIYCLGLKWSSVKRIIYSIGGLYGLVGSFLGVIMANGILWSLSYWKWFSLDPEVYFVDQIPMTINFFRDFIIVVFVVMICLLIAKFSIYQFNRKESHLWLRNQI